MRNYSTLEPDTPSPRCNHPLLTRMFSPISRLLPPAEGPTDGHAGTRVESVGGIKRFDFRAASVYLFGAVMLVLLSLSIFLNLYEGAVVLLPPLFAAVCIAAAGMFWTYRVGTRAGLVLFIYNLTLIAIGLFLVLCQGAPHGGSLFWFIVFPPMVMASLGLRNGSVVFFCFYAVLFLLLFTPLDEFLTHSYSWPVRVRFMFALFGAFFFSWWVEYLRHKTYAMLNVAIDRLERESLTDPLTGLSNRRDFSNNLMRIMSACRRKCEPYVLAFLDIDHFKRVNDRYGHPLGDKVLQHVARTLSQELRDTDRICRWGGEEFAMLMPACGPEQALVISERVRRRMEETPFVSDDLPEPISVTISIGVYCGTEQWDQERVLEIADANLYAAKASGRNRVVIGTPDLGKGASSPSGGS